LERVKDASRKLADDARHYSSPPFRYGGEADALRRASVRAAEVQDDPEAVARLHRLAAAVMHYHDTPPGHPDEPELRREMEALVRLVQAEPGPDDT
jgi:hypothetical protein